MRVPSRRESAANDPAADGASRPGKSRQLLRGLLESLSLRPGDPAATRRGRLLLESLEPRQMLAGDVELFATDGSADPDATVADASAEESSGLTVTGQGEGEAAPDLVQFAKDLEAAGVRFFGAAWCPACTQQKQLFEDGGHYLPFIEVTGPDRTPNQIGISEGITQYPTWEFPDGTREVGVLDLATLSQRSGVSIPQSENPTFEELGAQTVRIGSPLHLPIDAYDPDGGPLTVTLSVDDPSLLEATVISGNRSLRLDMAGFDDMVFELFEQRAPVPAGRVADLAESGFYDGIIFHRIVNNFVIQAGDPTGTGTSGSSLGPFDDQFHPDLQHNRSGVLSFAKTSDDTNNSQFFVTEVPTRHLDFNHSIFGQLVEGEDVREAISNMETNASGQPTTPITISSASVFTDTENSVIMLKALGGTGQTNVTVTVTDQDGNTHSEVVPVTIVNDDANSQPYLNEVTPPGTTPVDTPATLQLSSTDIEGDPVTYLASLQSSGNNATVDVDESSGLVTVTPASGFSGEVEVLVGVQASSATSDFDSQLVTFNFEGQAPQLDPPASLDLLASSDSGSSDTDNLTNAGSLTFRVTGVTDGNTVEIINTDDNSVIGTGTASGTTATITTNNVAALGDGTYVLAARQRDATDVSSLSPTLSLTYDDTRPASVVASASTQANVGREYSSDLISPEEGSGLVYAFTNAPSGATIDPSTGVIEWTPTTAQLGENTFTLELTDAAGNVRTESFSVEVADQAIAEIRLELTDLQGNPIDSIDAGGEFLLNMYGVDARNAFDRRGVFAAFTDILFDGNLVRPVPGSTIQYATGFTVTRTGTLSTGLIDELGAATSNLTPTDQAESLIATVRMEALTTGSVNFRSEPADAPNSEVLLYLRDDEVPDSQVAYGTVALAIGQSFTVSDDSVTVEEDSGSTVVDVLDNDEVVSGTATLSVVSVTQPSEGGTATLSGGSVSFTPASNFFGTTTFTYRVSDQNGVQSDATVTVTVTGVNDAPTGTADQFSVNEGTVLNPLDALANDSSAPDGEESLSVTEVSASANGATVSVAADGQSIDYTPPSGFTGVDTFTYTLSDGELTAEVQVSVTVAPADPPPTANADAFTLTEDDDEAAFDVLANDTADDDGEAFVLDSVGTPSAGGTARISSDGSQFFYQPAENFTGEETVSYTIRDTGGGLSLATVTFTVEAVNDPPPVANPSVTVNRANGEREVLRVEDLPSNVDEGETLTFAVGTSSDQGGTVRVSQDGSSIFYTAPSNDFTGSDSITYTVTDSNGDPVEGTITVEVVDFTQRVIRLTLPESLRQNLSYAAVTLSGTDALGDAVSLDLEASDDGFGFDPVLPGEYTINIPAIPFLQNATEPRQISVVSAPEDGDMEVSADLGRLRPEYLSIRDWLGSSQGSAIIAVVAPGSSAIFAAPTSSFDALDEAVVEMNGTGTSLTVRGNNGNGTEDVNLSTHGNPQVELRGQVGDLRLYRINLTADDLPEAAANAGDGEAQAASVVPASSSEPETVVPGVEGDEAAGTGSLTVGETIGEGEAPASSVSQADLFVPVPDGGIGRTDATVLSLPQGSVWASESTRESNSSEETQLLNESLADESNDSGDVDPLIDAAMSDVAEQLTLRSETADALAEQQVAGSGLSPDVIDAFLSDA